MSKSKVYFSLKNFEIDEFLQSYMYLVLVNGVQSKRVQSKKVLERKCSFLIHNLISRQISSHNDTAYLNAEVLKHVLGKEYKNIIDYLIDKKIIKVVEPYVNGVTSKGYRVVDLEENIVCSTKPYFYPYRPYVIGLEEELVKRAKVAKAMAQKNLSKPFYKKYENALNKLRINTAKAKEYIDIRFEGCDKNSRLYHLNILEEYKGGKHYIKVPNENDNRIYHILTRTPRELKHFLNIKFQVDIRNSHPLLFTALIYEKNGIRQNLFKKRQKTLNISLYSNNSSIEDSNEKEIKDTNNSKYNIEKYICNKLKDTGLDSSEIDKIRKMPFDVLKYIYLTSTGQFWDKVLEDDNSKVGGYDLTRQDVKGIMFGQVFYGKNLRIPRAYKYAKQFKEEFPNVYSLILSYKDGLKKEDRTVLSHKLMALESKLFREALRRLFEMGYEVVSIHDAIVVLDTPANANCSVEVVKEVLKEVYKEEGLDCECSVDIYGEKAMEEFLESERVKRIKGIELIDELRQEAKTDKNKARLLRDYEEGKSEIIWDNEKENVILHLKETKSLMYNKSITTQKTNPSLSLKKYSVKVSKYHRQHFYQRTNKSRLEWLK